MPILDAVRTAARDDVWSRGVRLVRDERVVELESEDDEYVLAVMPPNSAKPCTVHLWPGDSDWSCDCAATLRPCPHIAAAAIALRHAQESGKPLPQGTGPEAGAVNAVGYRFRREERGLHLMRVVTSGDEERPLIGTLAGRHDGGDRILFSDDDLAVEQALAHRFDMVVPRERWPRLASALEDCRDITLNGDPISVSSAPVVPQGWLEDEGEGFRIRIVRDPAIDEVLGGGVVRCGDTLRSIGDGGLSRDQRRVLSRGVSFGVDDVGQLVSDVLPRLEEKIPVHVRTQRLPEVDASPPRLVLETSKKGDFLVVRPSIVYGDPPLARVVRGELELVGEKVPVRSPVSENRLTRQIGETLRMAVGVETRLRGMSAVRFVDRLADFKGEVTGNGFRAFRRVDPIVPEVAIEEDRILADMGGADPEDVIAAWVAGEELVALPSGGWAPLPVDWLEVHGHRLADLLAARDATGRVARHALFDLAKLCEELDHPPPPGLDGIRTLVEGFEGIPDVPLPEDLTGELRSYQVTGVNWLTFLGQAGMGGVLADDMGLGKTIQALCIVNGRCLVVAPRSVLQNWANEAQRFRPDLKVAIYHGPHRELDEEADLTITTYALLRMDAERLNTVKWRVLILDEAQAIKNPESQVAQAAFGIEADFRVTLTGTPVENRLDELWSQMHFVNPGLLGGRKDFDERYSQCIGRGDQGVARRLRERIRPFILRRLKKDVAPELPPRTEQILHCTLSEDERTVYDTIRMATRARLVEQAGGMNVMAALEALLRLRQAACHSSLVPGQEADGSSKIDLLLDTLDSVVAEGHKALVFSQWTSLLDRIEPHLNDAGFGFVRLDGQTRDRQGVVDAFQADDGPPVMLLSLKAGGIGLNLTAADHVFLMDPWWNPAVEDQAADRTHRIGQDKPVNVFRMVAVNTVEERILLLQDKKRALAEAALGAADQAASITRDDLLALLA